MLEACPIETLLYELELLHVFWMDIVLKTEKIQFDKLDVRYGKYISLHSFEESVSFLVRFFPFFDTV